MRADDEHATAVGAQARVGVEQVGGAVQGDDGLPRPGAAVDDERTLGARADDRVLVGVGRGEDRLGRGRAPVDEQPASRAVGQPEPADVDGVRAVCGNDASEAEVQAEPAEGTEAGADPVDLQVAVQGCLAVPAGCPALGVEPGGELGDRLPEALGDGREVLLVGPIRARSASAARWSGRWNALVVRGSTPSTPI
ncbi:hypothetical protein [Blastococcus sp. VKM Ac-2987]|uniref:hypothetical protein n=1 Tax=Blastococcus sp. VKM Ac-2987 TaxID=3004141 RepID=UPI0022AB972A|nr:hypothetical protein [Blastococcus sp. VKM Ac-2987]MCZ2859203.1 hypothetical protein [Blastococcus sp. VKM Ac-2987]